MLRKNIRLNKRVIIGFFLSLSLLFTPLLVEATSATVLPSGIVIGDSDGIKVSHDGDYLIHITDVEPGKKWTTKITMINMERDIPYQLSMYITPPTLVKGSLDLSKAIQMTLIYEGETVYQGPLSGNSSSSNLQNELTPLNLGIFKSGDIRMLEAVFELDGSLYTNRDFFEKNIVENIWHFKAVKTSLPDTTNPSGDAIIKKPSFRLPQTGEEWRNALIYACIGLFIVLLTLLIVKYRVDQKKKLKKSENSK